MAMYLIEPWYKKKNDDNKTTTTYSVVRTASETYFNSSDTKTTSLNYISNVQRCPAVISSSSATYQNSTRISYTYDKPAISMSRLLISGDIYLMNSTNETTLCFSTMNESNYVISYTTNVGMNTRTRYTTARGGIVPPPQFYNTDNGMYVIHYNNITSYTSMDELYANMSGSINYPKLYLEEDNQYNLYDIRCNKQIGLSYFMNTMSGIVYFEVTDPSKITVVMPPRETYISYSPNLSQATIRMYRATLSETTIKK